MKDMKKTSSKPKGKQQRSNITKRREKPTIDVVKRDGTKTELSKAVLFILKQQKRNTITLKELARRANIKKNEGDEFFALIEEMKQSGEICEQKHAYVLSANLGLKTARVVKVHDTFGFVKPVGEVDDVFIPGKLMLGAMPDDLVLIKSARSRGNLFDGEIVQILTKAEYRFTGVVQKNKGTVEIVPDKNIRFPIEVSKLGAISVKEGDKVMARLSFRGSRHFEHRAEIVETYGSADSAAACCEATIAAAGINREFPAEVIEQAHEIEAKGIHPKEVEARLDLRDVEIFTIDGADTKDIDDAVSLKKTDEGWELGVHIADVSYYVFAGCALDVEAYDRGTSVYFANSVVPMLPPQLSNGICSLNPNEDRLAFSALMKLDKNCDLKSYEFKKTVICSKVKGVYSEINAIMDETADTEIVAKYAPHRDTIFNMRELAELLTKKRFGRGALNLESTESKIVLNDRNVAIDIIPRERGESEKIIEEFMLVANQAAAKFAQDKDLPFLYRIHENPSPEKLKTLKETLDALGIPSSAVQGGVTAAELSRILDKARETQFDKVVNNTLLRSMAKAKYSEKNVGHFGLVLDDYAHFTSPIRRYPDLIIHRIMSAYLLNMKRENIEKRYRSFVSEAGLHTSEREIRAMTAERDCDDSFKAEYIKQHMGKEFDGIISSAASHGLYIELENTVEGLVRAENLPTGDYDFDGRMAYTDKLSGRKYCIGDKVRVQVIGADVSAGQVDFKVIG